MRSGCDREDRYPIDRLVCLRIQVLHPILIAKSDRRASVLLYLLFSTTYYLLPRREPAMRYAWAASIVFLTFGGFASTRAQEAKTENREPGILESIRAKDLDGALKAIQEVESEKAAVSSSVRMQLAMALLRDNRAEDAAKQASAILDQSYQELVDKGNAGPFVSSFPTAKMLLTRTGQTAEAEAWLEKGLTAIKPLLSETSLTPMHGMYAQLLKQKGLSESAQANGDTEPSPLLEYVAKCEKLFASQSTADDSTATMIQLWNDCLQTLDDSQGAPYLDKVHAVAAEKLKSKPSVSVLQAYTACVSAYASSHARSVPESASQALETAKSVIDGLDGEDKAIAPLLRNFQTSIGRLEKTIADSLALQAMIGQPAPALDAMQWVHGEPTSLEGMRGKVVMLDFWAVWCGPCIATFPHLRHLNDEYNPRGLEIIGVTRAYNYAWDEDAGLAKRQEMPVSIDDELVMLDKFIGKYELPHRSLVTPEGSAMQSNYHVTGIPHAVVIDKAGIVRLVKVGSGGKNAQEIEAMIQKLLDE